MVKAGIKGKGWAGEGSRKDIRPANSGGFFLRCWKAEGIEGDRKEGALECSVVFLKL